MLNLNINFLTTIVLVLTPNQICDEQQIISTLTQGIIDMVSSDSELCQG